MNGVGMEQIGALIVAILGSNALTAWTTARQTRDRARAEAQSIVTTTYNTLIDQLSRQLEEAVGRIRTLEDNMQRAEITERGLSNRVAQLERSLITAGMDLPPLP